MSAINHFLAKTNPNETIQEHTDNLIANYKLLKETYPNLEINWDMLYTACLFHDLGKMNMKFQNKLQGIERDETEIAHNLLSISFINEKELKEKWSKDDIKVLVHAIAYHHNRGDYNAENYDEEVALLRDECKSFKYDKIKNLQVKKIGKQYFTQGDRIQPSKENYLNYVKIKGLLNRLDYASSAHLKVEIPNVHLLNKLNDLGYKWNELQLHMKAITNENVIVIAQTGMGKTEAALLWIGNNKGFFTLPLKTAINEIYKRVKNELYKGENLNTIGLLHSDTFTKYMEYASEIENIDMHYSKTKQLSLALTICTVDQLFDIVFKSGEYESKLATLAYSKIVIDEIQMYSPDLLAFIIMGVKMIDQIGGKFAIITATLPKFVVNLLKREEIFFNESNPFIDDKIRHSIKVIEHEIDCEMIFEYALNQKILVICNTVKKAQELYETVKNSEMIKEKNIPLLLLHSKFIKRDRAEKEESLFKMGQAEYSGLGICIATQVVEASLDIDFDILITELSEISGLMQRMGRCYRKRIWTKAENNVFVYIGNEKKCSGVGTIIDKDVHRLSRNVLLKFQGKCSESIKLNMVDEVYNFDSICDTEYYKTVVGNMEYLKSFTVNEFTKSEVKKRFRSIDNITVIPEVIMNDNRAYIEALKLRFKESYDLADVIEGKRIRADALNEVNKLTVSLRSEEVKGHILERYSFSKYYEFEILKCNYDFEKGIVIEKTKNLTICFDDRYL